MNVIHLSTSDIDGGAAIAAYRLHSGLRRNGVNSIMHVGKKLTDNASVITGRSKLEKGWPLVTPTIDKLPLLFYRKRTNTFFSPQLITNVFRPRVMHDRSIDVVNIHWICNGYLRIGELRKMRQPVVWTLHDMWPFTGGCHYTQDCLQYETSCGYCPQLGSRHMHDLSHYIMDYKKSAWSDLNLTIVAPSTWLAQCARSSSLFHSRRILVIPNGIDIDQYKPVNKSTARELLMLPQDKKLILFGAMNAIQDPRKGYQHLIQVLKILRQDIAGNDVEVVVFGSSTAAGSQDTPFPSHYIGRLHDDISLAVLYSACDVFIAPSVQDNLPNTIMEALACGTPCAAFHVGGMPDMIDHLGNGYLARSFDTTDLARGVSWILDDQSRWNVLSSKARDKVMTHFASHAVASRYADLYREIEKQSV